MGDVIDRRVILLRKQEQLKQTHGAVKGVELFKKKYGQQGVDDVFNYIVSCATPENYKKAEELGMAPGSYVIPM